MQKEKHKIGFLALSMFPCENLYSTSPQASADRGRNTAGEDTKDRRGRRN